MNKGFHYLATTYSRFPGGLEEAHRQACLAVAECFREGLVVFSPIAHSHTIALVGELGGDYETWQHCAEAMMFAAVGLIVVRMDGWEGSIGIAAEIEWFKAAGKPIVFRPAPRCPEPAGAQG
jgi:hypothetical protein